MKKKKKKHPEKVMMQYVETKCGDGGNVENIEILLVERKTTLARLWLYRLKDRLFFFRPKCKKFQKYSCRWREGKTMPLVPPISSSKT